MLGLQTHTYIDSVLACVSTWLRVSTNGYEIRMHVCLCVRARVHTRVCQPIRPGQHPWPATPQSLLDVNVGSRAEGERRTVKKAVFTLCVPTRTSSWCSTLYATVTFLTLESSAGYTTCEVRGESGGASCLACVMPHCCWQETSVKDLA